MDQRDAELQKMEHRINNESPFNRTLSREKEESYRSKRENDKNLYNPKVQNLVVEYSGDEQQASYLERVRKYPQNRPKEQPKSQLPNRSLDLGLHNRNLLPYIENPKPILVMVEPREGRRDTFYNKDKSSNRTQVLKRGEQNDVSGGEDPHSTRQIDNFIPQFRSRNIEGAGK